MFSVKCWQNSFKVHLFHERMWLEVFEAQISESMKQKDEGNRGTSWKSNPLQGVGEVVWSIPFL